MPRSKTFVYPVLCLPWAGAYFLLPTSSLSKLVLYNGIGLSAVVALMVGIRKNRPDHSGAWWFFAAGLTSFLTADVIYYVLHDIVKIEAFPTLADPFYLAMYPLVITGLVILIRAHSPGRDVAGLIDACIAAVSVFALLWVLVMDTYVVDDTMGVLARITSLAYPVMDVALLAVLARFAFVVRVRGAALSMMIVAIFSLFIADVAYSVTTIAGTFQTGSFIDAFWMLFYVLFANASLHPSMAEEVESAPQRPGRLTTARLVGLAVMTINVPLVNLFWGELGRVEVVVTAGSIALFLLVLGRVWLLVDAIKASHELAHYNSLHDGLTGLANRALLTQHLDEIDDHEELLTGVLFVDLDDFKMINDRLGHQAGDDLLKEVANRLSSCTSERDLVARLGGDEFAILVRQRESGHEITELAGEIVNVFSKPISLMGDDVLCSASVGVAVSDPDHGDHETLLRNADVAMYAAKSKGKRHYEFFEQAMYEEAVERLELRADLQNALGRGELEVFYQPIFEMGGNQVVSVEALMRWNHPTRGYIPPTTFIPLAEETGLIVELGSWVLIQACTQVSVWQRDRSDCADLGVSVNLSIHQLRDRNLVTEVSAALRRSQLEARHLTLELTESVLMHDIELGAKVLEQLRELGVRIAIDDFGTGYSSFGYLRRFAVDVIKIDRSFVAGLGGSDRANALTSSMVELARSLSLDAVAEGIEGSEQMTALANMGCKFGQGFFMAVPQPPRGLEQAFNAQLVKKVTSSVKSTVGEGVGKLSPWRPSRSIEVLHGSGAIEAISASLENLYEATGQPLMARSRWLLSWAEAHNTWEPLSVLVRDTYSNEIEAAALLAQRFRPDSLEVVGLGHGSSCTRLPTRNDESAQVLVQAIGEVLNRIPSRWRMELEQLPLGDPVATALRASLEHSHLVPDLRIPRVTFSSRVTVDSYLSRNMRKQIRRAYAHLEAQGIDVEVVFERDASAIAALIPKLMDAHVERDHLRRRSSDLDDPTAKTFWQRVIHAHNEVGKVEIATLRLGGELAAYVIGFADNEIWRLYDGHMVSKFSAYSPGRLLEAAVVDRVVADEAFVELDWMTGVAADKLLCSTGSEERVRLVAFSESRDDCALCQAQETGKFGEQVRQEILSGNPKHLTH